MLNHKTYIVADFETGGLDCKKHEPIELAAVAIDPYKLEIVPNSEFCSLMRPLFPDNLEAKALEVNGRTKEELLHPDVPHPKSVWTDFCRYAKSYNKGNSRWTAPILIAHNVDFDFGFMSKLARDYKLGYNADNDRCNLFFTNKDTVDLLFWWFEGSSELPNLRLDSFRDYTGYSKEDAHSALPDVIFTAKVLIRYLSFQRKIANSGKFRGAFSECS